MKKIFYFLILVCSVKSQAQTIDWSSRVAGIVYSKCASCHHQGAIAPFNLMSYNDAVAVAPGIFDAITDDRMPPWPPDTTYRKYAHQRTLNVQEKNDILSWISNGLLEGNTANEPAPPVFPVGTQVNQTPDLTVQIPPFNIAISSDIYQCFVMPSGVNVAKYIKGFEVIPGNAAAVHHVLVYADTTGLCATYDAQYPGPGYLSFGGTGSSASQLIGFFVPGADPQFYPNGMGLRLPPNADIVMQIHYPLGSSGQGDSTKVNFYFSNSPTVRPLYVSPLLNHSTSLTNGPLFIAANQTKTFYGEFDIPVGFGNISFLSAAAHMHLIGRTIKSYAVSPANDTVPFLKINDWDFKWQGNYEFQKIQKINAGSTLYFDAMYDNTLNNPYNPFNPAINIAEGEATTDEMMMVYFTFTSYHLGDEDIVQDSTLLVVTDNGKQQEKRNNINVWPNPTNGNQLYIDVASLKNEKTTIQLFDLSGRVVFSDSQVLNNSIYTVNLNDIKSNGLYILKVNSANYNSINKININR